MDYFETKFQTIYNGTDSLPGFLNTSLVFSIFFYVLNETLFLLGPPYLCTIFSFKDGSSPLTLKMSPFWFPTKNPKILFAPAVKEKSTVKQIV